MSDAQRSDDGTASIPDVRSRLRNVIDPCSEANGTNLDVIEMGLVRDVEVEGGRVTVDLRLTSPHCMMVPFFIERIDEEVGEDPAVESVSVTHDAGLEWTPEMITESGREKRERVQSGMIERARRAGPTAATDSPQ